MTKTITKLHNLLDAMEGAEHFYQEEAIMMEFLPHARDLLRVAEAAQDFLDSDGDYFSWTEDERHCLSRLKEALMALEGDV
jgi:hypothetical protein